MLTSVGFLIYRHVLYFSPFKIKINLNYIYTFSPYRAVNTLRHGYKNQSVNAV